MITDSASNFDARLNSLRRLFVLTLALLVVITTSVAWHFRSQKELVNLQLSQAIVNINQYEKQFMPQLNGLIAQLQNYSKTHPDIIPLLSKYGMLAPSGAPQTPAPANAIPAKK